MVIEACRIVTKFIFRECDEGAYDDMMIIIVMYVHRKREVILAEAVLSCKQNLLWHIAVRTMRKWRVFVQRKKIINHM